jgi:hypothetical protein
VLWRNPENLTERQTARLEEIAQTNQPLYLAYCRRRRCLVMERRQLVNMVRRSQVVMAGVGGGRW